MSDWIQTFSGKKFFPLEPEKNEYDIHDIAHALSLKCRFGGHCQRFYSVAEHCVRVADIVAPESKLWALLHDAAEAYLPDVCQPIKGDVYIADPKRMAMRLRDVDKTDAGRFPGMDNWTMFQILSQNNVVRIRTFRQAEDALLFRILKNFGVDAVDMANEVILTPPDIKQSDLILLATEARDLMGEPPEKWNLRVPVLPAPIVPWTAEEAEIRFLHAFEQMTAKTAG